MHPEGTKSTKITKMHEGKTEFLVALPRFDRSLFKFGSHPPSHFSSSTSCSSCLRG